MTRHPAITIDLFPTFVSLAGGGIPSDRIIDGRDISPILSDYGPRPDENFYFYIDRNLRACRSGPWKLVLPTKPATRPSDPRPMLFNLEKDISEKTNLAQEHPEIVARLQELVAAFKKSL